jgi:hypothetical protein
MIAASDALVGAGVVLVALWFGAGVAGLLVARAVSSLVVSRTSISASA